MSPLRLLISETLAQSQKRRSQSTKESTRARSRARRARLHQRPRQSLCLSEGTAFLFYINITPLIYPYS